MKAVRMASSPIQSRAAPADGAKAAAAQLAASVTNANLRPEFTTAFSPSGDPTHVG